MAEKDFSEMSDEEFMEELDNVANGIEDTDQTETTDETETTDTETNEDDDDLLDDTENIDEEDTDGSEEANSQEDEDGEEGEEEAQEVEDEKTTTEETTTTTEPTDYKAAYDQVVAEKKKYEDFYKEATAEFVANGQVVKGTTDPKKIKQAQQMAAGFSDKMKSFKKYRPFIKPLVEKGLADDPARFNLALNALDGDPEAIKQLIKQADIDPIEFDMEDIKYEPKNQLASDIEVAYDEVMETASQHGVKERIESVVSKDWDDQSVVELLEDPQNSADLINHLSTGVYDLVQERIAQKKMSDTYGAYSGKRAIDQYREAAAELEEEFIRVQQQEQYQAEENQYAQAQEPQFSEAEIQAEMERIKQENNYKQKVEKRNTDASNARKKAASVSKKKNTTKKTNNEFDVAKLSDDEFEDMLQNMIAG